MEVLGLWYAGASSTQGGANHGSTKGFLKVTGPILVIRAVVTYEGPEIGSWTVHPQYVIAEGAAIPAD